MITSWLEGDRQIEARFERIEPSLREHLREVVGNLGYKLETIVKRDYLTGQVLAVRSGLLRKRITSKLTSTDTTVEASVGPNMEVARYAAAWEFGFDRKVGAGARGGPRTLIGKAKERYMLKHPAGVKHYAARPYMHPAFESMRAEIIEKITQAVGPATK